MSKSLQDVFPACADSQSSSADRQQNQISDEKKPAGIGGFIFTLDNASALSDTNLTPIWSEEQEKVIELVKLLLDS